MQVTRKIKKYLVSVRPTIYKILAIILLSASLYVYGTFNPNIWTQEKIERKVEDAILEQAFSFGLHEPEFVYNDDKTFVKSLTTCINYINFTLHPTERVPSSIIIAMAGVESAWGTSRFAVDGNNLFGIRTWDKKVKQLKPLDLPNAEFGVKIFKTKCESVREMVRLLNEHHAYDGFREERDNQIEDGKWHYRKLLNTLDSWSTNPKYAGIINDVIIKRNLP